MSDEMFIVDLEFRDGHSIHPNFVTRQEAVSYAGRMAMDSRVHRVEVRGLGMDAPELWPGLEAWEKEKKDKAEKQRAERQARIAQRVKTKELSPEDKEWADQQAAKYKANTGR